MQLMISLISAIDPSWQTINFKETPMIIIENELQAVQNKINILDLLFSNLYDPLAVTLSVG